MRALELRIDNHDYFCVTYRFKKYNDKIPIMRDKIGNRPIEVKELGGNLILKFYPMAKTAKNPDKVLFCLTMDSEARKKLEKICKGKN